MHDTQRARRRSPGKLIAAGLVGFALLAAACGGDDGGNAEETTTSAPAGGSTTAVTPAPPSTTVAKEKPVPGGTLRVGVEAEVSPNWVPGQMQCDSPCQLRARSFFEPLMALDTTNKLQPYLLAEAPTPNAEFTMWTLKVRDGVTFHDGAKLDAAAVVANLTRNCVTGFIGLAFQGIKGCGFGGKIEEAQTGIIAKDAMTVEVATKAPYATFPYLLTTQGAFMSSPAWYQKVFVDKDQTAGASPVGTGPFVFDSWKPGDTLKVKKNPNYWRKDADGNAMPYLDGIEFKVIADELTRKSAFKSGQLDLMPTDNGENIKEFRADGKDAKIGYLEQSELGETFYILLHVGQEGSPLQDKRVRCALLQATDKKTLAETTGAGVFPLANGLFS
ncbi:MAG TPA: ABC transporter substrate-binding protein, partial [Acidimicrobiales bacterium]